LDYRDHVVVDDKLYCPSELHILQGDTSKTLDKLGWLPSIIFEELAKQMKKSDLNWYSKT